ncbi:hypothetical protein LUZ60_011990 [Juncus effusus]|nr:hypothetical protein LUZ60_011990 [Juncus effusus]
MNDPSQMMNRGFGMWPPPPPMGPPPPAMPPAMGPPVAGPPGMEDLNLIGFQNSRPVYTDTRNMNMINNNWKGKKPSQGGYKPPALSELQYQNRVKARRFYPKKKNAYPYPHPNQYPPHPRFAPFAPRNTSSFIIRAKKSGGITSHVSPCPVTPAILPTPKFSPSREVLMDMAKEEWGVDGYGSMSGLIRLRSPQDNEEIEEDGSSESDVEEHVEVERRLDHDLSRFEMVYPGDGAPGPGEEEEGHGDGQVARLEEENLLLKDRLYIMEREMGDLRRRLQALEASCGIHERFGDVDQNFGDAFGENHREENSINGNNGGSEENEGVGIVCSEKSASPARD